MEEIKFFKNRLVITANPILCLLLKSAAVLTDIPAMLKEAEKFRAFPEPRAEVPQATLNY